MLNWLRDRLLRKLTRESLDPLVARWATEERTLDLGCGSSRYAKHFPNRVAVDNQMRPGVHVVADAHFLPFKSEMFEVVLCTEMLEHVFSPHNVILEIRRVLKTLGNLLLSTRFVYPIHDAPYDFYRFTKYGLRYLLRDYEVRELRPELDTVATYAALAQRIAFQTDLRGGKMMRGVVLALAHAVRASRGVIKREYGDINRDREEEQIMASGYFVVARKQRREDDSGGTP